MNPCEPRQQKSAGSVSGSSVGLVVGSFIDNVRDAVWGLDRDFRIVALNEECRRIFSVAFGIELRSGDEFLRRAPDEELDFWRETHRRALTGERFCFEYRYFEGDGSDFKDLEVCTSPIPGDDGEPRTVLYFGRDITDRKITEKALRASRQKYRDLANSLPLAVFEVDLEGHLTFVNRTAYLMFRYPRQELAQGLYFEQMVDEKDRAEAVAVFRRLAAGEDAGFFEFTALRKDGSTFAASVVAQPIQEGACIRGIRGIVADVTERKESELALQRSEEQLRQSQKMEALGRLAGGVAHDFNNLLTSILGFSRLALESIDEKHPARADIAQVVKDGERASKLTGQLLAVARKQVVRPRPIDLSTVVNDMEPLLRRTLGEDIELRIEHGDDLGSVEADTGAIEQVVLNLCVNARDAMPQGGTLTIMTRRSSPNEKSDIDWVMLSVKDNGSGMSAEIRERAFEPFYTTKGLGRGSGLGLSTVYGIVQQFNGYIELESAPGMGTDFRIFFPRLTVSPSMPSKCEERDIPRGVETILVVEDDEAVRRFMARILHSLGYTVLEAANAGEALLICERRGNEPIHLVLTDVVMPQMSGSEVVERLRKVRSDFKVLYSSGFAHETLAQHGVEDSSVIIKPFTKETLAVKVQEALGNSGTP